ncbi:primosomal protein N' [Arthrobacter roseus]|uniref:primosomal protein N' n=1 Tax=Arthrobacter roseus TaxID=136274 RepID=UPI001964918F|nr:primosomal protein N' [Arthrobacter roseus]MBM7848627.1 primosomal protein N' (replication factor Y) [Arthrobacter roseus]
MRPRDAGESHQPSLLLGFPVTGKSADVTILSGSAPYAGVVLDSSVPHLDREFDYVVPEELSDAAQPGCRVKIGFAGRIMAGYISERRTHTSVRGALRPLSKVMSSQPVAQPVLMIARLIADRYAGTLSDVLRSAVPPRVARVDKEFADRTWPVARDGSAVERTGATSADTVSLQPELLKRYTGGGEFVHHLASGENPRAVLTSLGGYGQDDWAAEISEAINVALNSGRGALAVVPDARDLAVLEAALKERVGADRFVRLSAEDGPTPRYRNFLKLLHGDVRVAIGTRSAAYAPVRDLGLVCLWDDGDSLLSEPRAPYQHAREVLLLRAEYERSAVLLSAFSRSAESQRLVETGWAHSLQADRAALRGRAPRVLHTSDSFQSTIDPLAQTARIPHSAWRVAKTGLESGPVLIQVARAGFAPALACVGCRELARCSVCSGPLALSARGAVPTCRWCGHPENAFRCKQCGDSNVRVATMGAGRTAEDLGRAFPSFPVVSSSGDHIIDQIPDRPAIVVATPGAEPQTERGYAAALLLDGDIMLNRESLRASEEARRRWFNAAVLVRSAADGGTVAVTARDSMSVASLVRWDPAGAASRELAERREVGLPPAVRTASLTGSPESLAIFMDGLDLPHSVRVAGPVAVEDSRAVAASRLLLFFSFQDAAHVVRQLKERKSGQSTKHLTEPVHVRVDPSDAV